MRPRGSPLPAYRSALFWFRRDLRDTDNAGLYFALRSAGRVYCAFVFDREITDALPSRADRRLEFIHDALAQLSESLAARGGALIVLHDRAREAIPALARRLGVDAVFANGDYEPQARSRDDDVARAIVADGRRFHLAKDQAVFEKDEVLAKSGRPFTVFTPYRNAWMKLLDDFYVEPYPVERHARALARPAFESPLPPLESLGFERTDLAGLGLGAGMRGAREGLERFLAHIDDYHRARDFPAVDGVS